MPTAADPTGPVVVDASAVVALLIDPGDAGDRIGSRIRDAHVLAPAHLHVEVANVLRRQRNAGRLSRDQALAAFRALCELPVDIWAFEAYAERTWRLGDNLSSYDAAYVALAEEVGAPLVTRDARIGRAAGVACTVEVI